jgi:hypothetical protein
MRDVIPPRAQEGVVPSSHFLGQNIDTLIVERYNCQLHRRVILMTYEGNHKAVYTGHILEPTYPHSYYTAHP